MDLITLFLNALYLLRSVILVCFALLNSRRFFFFFFFFLVSFRILKSSHGGSVQQIVTILLCPNFKEV